jgi:hypothetical protein
MKRLYIRFFTHKDDQIPADSYFVCVDNCGRTEQFASIQQSAHNISPWMTAHPEGKVDFIWA